MKAQVRERPPRPARVNVDQSHSSKALLTQEKSQQEDSNASFFNNGEPIRILPTEDSSFVKIQSSQSRRLPPNSSTRISPQLMSMKRSRSTHQKEENSMPSQSSFESPIRLYQHDSSNILGRISVESRHNDMDMFLKREASSPFGFGEVDSMPAPNFGMQSNRGPPREKGLPRPLNMDDYTNQDYLEEQDVVHSLRIKNTMVKRNSRIDWYSSQEESKDIASEDEVRNVPDKQPVQVSLGTIRIKSNPLSPGIINIENLENNESTGQEGFMKMDLRRPGSDLAHISSGRDQPENQNQNVEEVNVEQPAPVAALEQQATNVQQAPTQQVQTFRPTITKVEAQLFLRERTALFVALSIASLFVWLMLTKKTSARGIIVAFYCYFAYISMERGYIGFRSRYSARYRKENKLEFLCNVSCIIALVLCDLALSDVIPATTISVIPLAISTIIYAIKSPASQADKKFRTLIKLGYTLQILLLTLKFDTAIDFEWVFAVILILMFLGSLGALAIIYILFLVLLANLVVRQNFQDRVLSRKLLFIGLSWNVLYYGLGMTLAFLVVGLIALVDPEGGPSLMIVAAMVNFVYNALLAIYTLGAFKQIIKFIQYFSSDRMFGVDDPQPEPKPIVNFEVEQKKTYFMSLSSTYFLPLTRDFLGKSKANIDRIKDMFRESKLKRSTSKRLSDKEETKQNKSVNKQTLQQYKEALDSKLDNVLRERPQKSDYASSLHKFLKMFSPRAEGITLNPTVEGETDKNYKLCLSVDHMEDLEGVYSKPKQISQQEDEKLCYLCYANPPNCVLMNCGHGGFCYECATAAIKVKNECMECRTKVEAIHKIDPEAKLTGIVKTIEITKLVLTIPAPPQQIT